MVLPACISVRPWFAFTAAVSLHSGGRLYEKIVDAVNPRYILPRAVCRVSRPAEITLTQARKLALLRQQLPRAEFKRGLAGTRLAIQHLGYVQIDTISVVERAHHHTLWNRVPHYRNHYIDRLIRDGSIFEYWAHAAAYIPMEDYRFCLPRMRAIAGGQRHWYRKNPKLMREILARVRAEGPLQAGDFESHRANSGGMWEWGPVKQAIEYLFMEGKLLVTRRDRFRKIFDLAERIIPPAVDTTMPTEGEYAHYLIERFLNAHGVGRMAEFSYRRPGMGAAVRKALYEKVEAGAVSPLKVRTLPGEYFARRDFERDLGKRLARTRVKILSPFDNLIIQRKRVQQLFSFDFQLECYLPRGKRKDGYFCLPILWSGRLVARMDAKADRKNQALLILQLKAETGLKKLEAFSEQLSRELNHFMKFNQCKTVDLGNISPPKLNVLMRRQQCRRHWA